jgi:signal transduction histidine kinase
MSDTGRGIPAEIQNRIFEPFFTTKPRRLGKGLGLAVVYGIVTQTGREISVQSAPGQSATFSLRFPRA